MGRARGVGCLFCCVAIGGATGFFLSNLVLSIDMYSASLSLSEDEPLMELTELLLDIGFVGVLALELLLLLLLPMLLKSCFPSSGGSLFNVRAVSVFLETSEKILESAWRFGTSKASSLGVRVRAGRGGTAHSLFSMEAPKLFWLISLKVSGLDILRGGCTGSFDPNIMRFPPEKDVGFTEATFELSPIPGDAWFPDRITGKGRHFPKELGILLDLCGTGGGRFFPGWGLTLGLFGIDGVSPFRLTCTSTSLAWVKAIVILVSVVLDPSGRSPIPTIATSDSTRSSEK